MNLLGKLGEICATVIGVIWLAALVITIFTFTLGTAIWSTQWLFGMLG